MQSLSASLAMDGCGDVGLSPRTLRNREKRTVAGVCVESAIYDQQTTDQKTRCVRSPNFGRVGR